MKRIRRLIVTALALGAVVVATVPNNVFAQSPQEFATGLNEPTPEQVQWMKDNFPVIQKVRLNQVAFDRINADRKAKGMAPLPASQMDLAPMGKEAVFAPGKSDVETVAGATELPDVVDNSVSDYFPPIGDQGQIGSCVAWATTYYQLTYETNLALKTPISDDGSVFSPKWTYNMINGGVDGGSYFDDAYSLELKNGAATYAQFPYTYTKGNSLDYRAWDLNSSDWNDALNYRPQTRGSLYSSNADTMINNIKTTLLDGHIMVIGTYVYSWVMGTVANDGATTADDAFVGEDIAKYETNSRQGGHGMTIVGYNDAIWCDLNGNGVVEPGEKGAFKIANSWGNYWNDGFVWITYDSLRTTSAVSGWSSSRNTGGIFYSGSVWVLTVQPYTPTMKAEVTLNQAKRSQVSVTLGVGSTSSNTPAHTWSSEAVYNSGGNYAFDGTTTAVDGTFFFDFSDLTGDAGPGSNRWFVGIRDNRSGSVTTIKSFKLYAGDNVVAEADDLPRAIDGGQAYVWVDYAAGTTDNHAPAAVNDFYSTNEETPLTVASPGVLANDTDAETDQLTAVLVSGPAHATSFGLNTDGSFTYTPVSDYYGTDTFTYKANDGTLDSAPATVAIDILNTNDPPSAADDYATVAQDSGPTAIPVLANDSYLPDPAETLTIISFTPAQHGTVAIISGGTALTYQPNTGFSGSDMFEYTIDDGHEGTASATVSVTVNPPNETMHVGDIDASTDVSRNGKWNVTVTITIYDASGSAASGATVYGTWSDAAKGSASGTTGPDGTVSFSKGSLRGTSATFTVTNVTHNTLVYDPAQNSFNFITVSKP